MSSTLVVLIPLALLGMVTLLGFAGCNLGHAGRMADFYEYQGTVIGHPQLIALWPLSEVTGTTATAVGRAGPEGFEAHYTMGVAAIYDGVNLSAGAVGGFEIGQPGIVPGDAHDHDPNQRSPCPFFGGGFVNILWAERLNPRPPFTLEAWVKPTWTDQDVTIEPALRGVVMAINRMNNSGFGLFATPDNYWAGGFGIGSTIVQIAPPTGSNQKITLNAVSFLVLTFDGTTAKLYVNPAETTMPYAQGTVSGFVPVSVTTPTSTYIGAARPDLPAPPSPGFPFQGYIQDVALYDIVLDDMTIQRHYLNGNGMSMG